MLKLGSERNQLNIVFKQIRAPTYAGDLVKITLCIVEKDSRQYGVYHYSNEGVASWHDFSKAIFDINTIYLALSPIKTDAFPTPAKRP